MQRPVFAVYGASGFGREVMPLVRRNVLDNGGEDSQLFFVDDAAGAEVVNGHVALSYSRFRELTAPKHFVVVAIANSSIRAKVAQRCADDGLASISIRASNVVILDGVNMGEGAIICPFVTLTSNITIGRHFHANIYSYVAHDCHIGDYVTFAPAVKCNGNVVIGDHAYIGTGAIIKQGAPGKPLTIGQGAVVGMGAVVTKDVPAGVTVVGNPARILNKNS